MKIKSYSLIIWGILIFVVSFLVYVYFTKTPYFKIFHDWSQSNLLLFTLVLFLLKTLGVVYPPLPSGLFTLAAIPIIGWFPAYLIDFAGSMAAAGIDYYLGRKYGYVLLRKIFDTQTLEKIQKLKIKPNREIESIFVMRILLGMTILEAVYYGGGLLGVKFKNFMIGASLSHTVVGVPTFLIGQAVFQGKSLVLSFALAIVSLYILYKIKGRYFE